MAPIRNVFKAMEYIENQATPEEETDFEARVIKAYEHPNTLEYAKATDKANELINAGLTSGKMIARGEKAAQELCGPDIADAAVVVGAMKKLEELKKIKIAG